MVLWFHFGYVLPEGAFSSKKWQDVHPLFENITLHAHIFVLKLQYYRKRNLFQELNWKSETPWQFIYIYQWLFGYDLQLIKTENSVFYTIWMLQNISKTYFNTEMCGNWSVSPCTVYVLTAWVWFLFTSITPSVQQAMKACGFADRNIHFTNGLMH